MKRVLTSLLFVLCLFAVPVTRADEGRIPLYQRTGLDWEAGAISGKYILTRDITVGGTAIAIDIRGSGVENIELDLNGFTVTGGVNSSAVIRVRGAGVRTFVLRNGTVVGGNSDYEAAVIKVLGDETDPSDSVTIEDLKIIAGGMAIEGTWVTNFQVRRNVIVQSAVGIIFTNNFVGSAPRMTGVIEDNILRNLEFDAIDILDPNRSVTIRNNQIVGQSGTGITVDETLSLVIEGNNIEGGTVGIDIIGGKDCVIKGNAVTSGSGSGIGLLGSTDCFVYHNIANGNGFYGIELFGESTGNFIDRNVMNGNGWMGLSFDIDSADNAYGRNVMRDNGGGVSCTIQNAPQSCSSPAVCDSGTNNTSFGDNMGPGKGVLTFSCAGVSSRKQWLLNSVA